MWLSLAPCLVGSSPFSAPANLSANWERHGAYLTQWAVVYDMRGSSVVYKVVSHSEATKVFVAFGQQLLDLSCKKRCT